jgi:hypothetical protein
VTTTPLPPHYLTTIRRLVRFAVVNLMVGLCLGVWSTAAVRELRYGDRPRAVHEDPVKVELPPGLMWEATMDLRLSHGHVILIGAVLPLCLAAALYVTARTGGAPIGAGTLAAFFWTYAVGGLGALALIVYKGWFVMHEIEAATDHDFDMARIQAEEFLGSHALRGALYGTFHTALAAAVGVIMVALWRSAGSIRPQPSA